MKVLNYGSLNYDFVYQVPHMVSKGETLSSNRLDTHFGGKGLNQSLAMARAGLAVAHAGAVGEDGDGLINVCRDNGVDIQFIRHCKGKSGHAIIQVNVQGENCILLFPGANEQNSEEQIEQVLEAFGKGDYLVLQNEINCLDILMKKAYEKELKIVLNPSPFRKSLLECPLDLVSLFVLNEIEGNQMTGKEEPKEILEQLGQMYPGADVVLTLGSKGSYYKKGMNIQSCDCFSVKAVDTTAAGDTFTGYLLHAITEGKSLMECLQWASAAAAIAVTREGAESSIPWKNEVVAFLNTNVDLCDNPQPK